MVISCIWFPSRCISFTALPSRQGADMRLDFQVVSKGQGNFVDLIRQLLMFTHVSHCTTQRKIPASRLNAFRCVYCDFVIFVPDNQSIYWYYHILVTSCKKHFTNSGMPFSAVALSVFTLDTTCSTLMHYAHHESSWHIIHSTAPSAISMHLSFSGRCQHQCLTTAHGIVNSLQCPNNEGCSLASASPHLSKRNFVSPKLVVMISHANRLSATSLTSYASYIKHY